MKFGRYQSGTDIFRGELEGDRIYRLTGELEAMRREEGSGPISLASVKTLAPVMPNKIIAIGPGHNDVLGGQHEPPERPYLFFKPCPGTVTHPGDPIVFPAGLDNILWELEIAIVIGKQASRVSRQDASGYILGYTCCNDITAGDLRRDWGQPVSYYWKAFDTFAPLGPVVATDLGEIEGLAMTSRVNGEVKYETVVSLIYSPEDLVSWISQIMTLYPGDIISTGAAANGDLKVGDVCEIEVEGIGCLSNPVVAADAFQGLPSNIDAV